ncbi:MAG: double-strand break repair helicase AddA [Pseudomonadota bacterium]
MTHADVAAASIGAVRSHLIETTELAQRQASDPFASAWVSANAGAGKTHVLKMRVLRLLLSGADPARILCLTYTNAAAAEMSERVFAELAKWSACDDDQLANELHGLLGHAPGPGEAARARQLFACVVDAPGGLTVKTIHSFCERLLQRFPLEAGLSPGFETLDEQASRALQTTSIDKSLMAAACGDSAELGAALDVAIAFAADERFEQIVSNALGQETRAALRTIEHLRRQATSQLGARDVFDLYLRARFGIDADENVAALTEQIANVLTGDELALAVSGLADGGKSDVILAQRLDAARLARSATLRASLLTEAFLTRDGTARSDRFITKAVREAAPAVADRLTHARDAVAWAERSRRVIRAITATCGLATLTGHIHTGYDREKAHQPALDFEDLIDRTIALLANSKDAQWVLFKLDGGLDHILIDEAQDTSARQWRIVETLASEFFAGSEARDVVRTVFGVGDEKQSIYSFQGAAPKLFAQAGRTLGAHAVASGSRFHEVPLTVSFRTTSPILESVDRVFSDPKQTPGVGHAGATPKHTALRIGEAGLVEIWPLEAAAEQQATPAFDPLGDDAVASPTARLAKRIAGQIRYWLDSGERLASKDRPIRPGDIMILLRRRRPLGPALIAELKRHDVPVAGADRLALTEHISVQDLLAVADFVTLPEDDLALACVLKSPLFCFDDDDLTALAPGRKGSLWSAMIRQAASHARYAEATDLLRYWRALADRIPPFEFFNRLLESKSRDRPDLTYRRMFLSRLGPDASEPLDEFLERALAFDDTATPSLQGFAHWMRTGAFEIKRDMEQGSDQVRVMTVHGAKGLEANVVFLPDTTVDPRAGGSNPLVDLNAAEPDAADTVSALFWPVAGTGRIEPAATAKRHIRDGDVAESNRLLYVAMTRARDRLYVGGIAPGGGRRLPDHSWYALIEAGLDDILVSGADHLGQPVRRYESQQNAMPEADRRAHHERAVPEPPPQWADTPVRPEPQLQIPIVPSRLALPDTDEQGDPVGEVAKTMGTSTELPAPVPPREQSGAPGEHRFLRGTITHALFQYLPVIGQDAWETTAARFVGVRGNVLSATVQRAIVQEVISILRAPRFLEAFGANSRAEVPLVAEVPHPSGDGRTLRISGQIDRLVETATTVTIIDFKSNRDAATQIGDVPDAYLLQLAAYRLAVQGIFPTKEIHTALLWTAVPQLMEIDASHLEAHVPRLWSA